jgi:hypothetical protein
MNQDQVSGFSTAAHARTAAPFAHASTVRLAREHRRQEVPELSSFAERNAPRRCTRKRSGAMSRALTGPPAVLASSRSPIVLLRALLEIADPPVLLAAIGRRDCAPASCARGGRQPNATRGESNSEFRKALSVQASPSSRAWRWASRRGARGELAGQTRRSPCWVRE